MERIRVVIEMDTRIQQNRGRSPVQGGIRVDVCVVAAEDKRPGRTGRANAAASEYKECDDDSNSEIVPPSLLQPW